MRTLLVFLMLAPAAHAQVIECPKFYPWQDTPISEVPYQHKGQGMLAKTKLSGAGVFTGDMGGNAELIGDRRQVRGGWDARFDFGPGERKWLVCAYGSSIAWWEQLDEKVVTCTVQERQSGRDPMSVKATCR